MRETAKAFTLRFLALWLLLYWITGLWPIWDAPTNWFARNILRIDHPVNPLVSRSDSGQFAWVRDLFLLVLAVVGAGIWSALRRAHPPGPRARAWVQFGLRVALAVAMIPYSSMKVIPVQMEEPTPSVLMSRFGDFPPWQVLWASMGAAPGYEIVTGVVELASVILLVLPRVWPLGAALAAVAGVQVLLVNVFYDIGVKRLAIQLVIISLILLTPRLKRVWDALVANRRVDPLPPEQLASRRWLNIAVQAVVVLLVVCVLGGALAISYARYTSVSASAPKPPLYGAWQAHAPSNALEYFIVDGYKSDFEHSFVDPQHPHVDVIIELTGGTAYYAAGEIRPIEHTIILSEPDDDSGNSFLQHIQHKPGPPNQLHYVQPIPEQLTLTGDWNRQHLDLTLDKIDLSKLPLNRDRGIHWIQEAPQ